ncbi:MAG: hypothetical protein KJ949_01255 [Nanoarchaeota archaeon]|nr:hypothetical protein [Nanoarchaeota archaeon]
MLNKKAQLSETMTWIVATLVIIVILIIFIFISSSFAKVKNLTTQDLKLSSEGEDVDLFEFKTELAYNLTSEENKKIIDNWRKQNA